MTHAELKKLALQDDNVKAEYEALEPEFSLLRDMLKARKEAGLSQAEVAARMGTQGAWDKSRSNSPSLVIPLP
jgi:hypothetical protein